MFAKTRAVLTQQLRQGLTVRQASLAVALGLTCGVFPILGCTTAVSIIAAWILRLNQPLVISFNLFVFPPKLALIIPFLRIGEWLFRAPALPLDVTAFTARWVDAPLLTTQTFAMSFVHAIVGWMVLAPLITGLSFLLVRPIVAHTAEQIARLRSAPPAA